MLVESDFCLQIKKKIPVRAGSFNMTVCPGGRHRHRWTDHAPVDHR
jgi:hypothetical protein